MCQVSCQGYLTSHIILTTALWNYPLLNIRHFRLRSLPVCPRSQSLESWNLFLEVYFGKKVLRWNRSKNVYLLSCMKIPNIGLCIWLVNVLIKWVNKDSLIGDETAAGTDIYWIPRFQGVASFPGNLIVMIPLGVSGLNWVWKRPLPVAFDRTCSGKQEERSRGWSSKTTLPACREQRERQGHF